MSEEKELDTAPKKGFAKSLALIQKSQESTSSDERKLSRDISSITDLLTEFLTSIMTKDYEQALMYCTEILCSEPKNATAREFYPLIVEKLEMLENDPLSDSSSTSDSSLNSSSSSENIFFNKPSGICLKKTEDSLKKPSDKFDLGERKTPTTSHSKNVAISSSVSLGKKLKPKNKGTLEFSSPDEKPTE